MPVQRLASSPDILAALPTVMAGHRRLAISDVVAGLRAAGLRLAPVTGDAAEDVLDAVDTADGAYAYQHETDEIVDAASLLEGVILTHRLNADDVANRRVDFMDDIPGRAFDSVFRRGLVLPSGQVVRELLDEAGPGLPVLDALEEAGLGAGDLIGFRFTGGAAHLVDVTDTGSEAEVVERLRRMVPEAGSVSVDQVFDVLIEDPTVFRSALRPLREIIDDNGFGFDGLRIASSPSDAAAAQIAEEVLNVTERWEIDEGPAVAAVGLLHLIDSLDEDESYPIDPELLSAAGEVLADQLLAYIVAEETTHATDGATRLVSRLRADRRASADRRTRAGCAYLLGRALESQGEPLAAEAEYGKAMQSGPEHPDLLLRLAGIAADRGQFATAQRLLEQAEALPEYPLWRPVQAALDRLSAQEPQLGRNEPCWCGSGRKFKVCHGRPGMDAAPVDPGSVLLLALAWGLIDSPESLHDRYLSVMEIAGERGVRALATLAADIQLFEGGLLADYLRRRGALLAAEQVLMAQQWLLRPRSLFEVEERHHDVLTLRDLMTGDRTDTPAPDVMHDLNVGELLLARPASIGDHDSLYAPLRVPLSHRQVLLDHLASDAEPLLLVPLLADMVAGPQVVTSEGEPILDIEGTFTTMSPARLRSALDKALEAAGPDAWDLTEPGIAGGSRVLASASLSGNTLSVTAMTMDRYERMVAVLDGLDVPLTEQERAVGDFASSIGTDPVDAAELPADPQTESAIAAFIELQEQSWLDERIPALGGATPREAASDPTRRDDLIRLLSTFPSGGSPLEMDGGRLSKALEL